MDQIVEKASTSNGNSYGMQKKTGARPSLGMAKPGYGTRSHFYFSDVVYRQLGKMWVSGQTNGRRGIIGGFANTNDPQRVAELIILEEETWKEQKVDALFDELIWTGTKSGCCTVKNGHDLPS